MLISKPEKKLYKKKNYRPIAFVDIDVKIFIKILAKRIQQYAKAIHNYQVRFIPGIQNWLNIKKSNKINYHFSRL